MCQTKFGTEEILRKAFEFYDEDKNGYITKEELHKVFGSNCNDEQLNDIMKEADLNGDNEISFAEFKKMMNFIKLKAHNIKFSWSIV